ncbi:MAG: RNA polymerase sigma factor [Acidobacteriia bacterium]|nr:RNA polymerase sigma factor [Terriglobia bacterium]
MSRAQTGQDESTTQGEFESFYARTARTLHGYLCRLSADPATADEVLQETYIRMLSVPAMEEGARKAYLYKTATNLLRDRWRKIKREKKWWELSVITERVHHNLNLPVDMETVFNQLSAQEQAILWLAHVEELSHKEIGEVLSVKEKSVRVMVFRAREKAKALLETAGFRGSHE